MVRPGDRVFLIANANRPVQAQAGFTVIPNYSFNDAPSMDAFLIPGGMDAYDIYHRDVQYATPRPKT